MMLVKRCAVCGTEFEAVGPNAGRQKYCSKACLNAYWNRNKRKQSKSKAIKATHDSDFAIPYNPKQAQASHDRQAEINQRARDMGLSYGKYQMKLYMERVEG